MQQLKVGDNVLYKGTSTLISKDIVGKVRVIVNDIATVNFGHFVGKYKLSDLELYVPSNKPLDEITITVEDFKAIKAKVLDSDYFKNRVPNFDISERGMLVASGEVILQFFKEELFKGDKSL